MDKRFQVFVSSTYEDLKKEREEVIRALLELDCIPVGMELFPAADDDAWTLIKQVIDDSDYYIVISAGRYGSVHPETEVGFTEMEYDYAVHTGKPALAFLHADRGSIPSDRCESESGMREKLEAFRDKMRQKVTKDWNGARDLGAVASRGIVQLMRQEPGVGWIRADRASSNEEKLENLQLRAEITKLQNQLKSSSGKETDLDTNVPLTEKLIAKINSNPINKDFTIMSLISFIEEIFERSQYYNKLRLRTMLGSISLNDDQARVIISALLADGILSLDSDGDCSLTTQGRAALVKLRLKTFLED
jgi:hypothetical protein